MAYSGHQCLNQNPKTQSHEDTEVQSGCQQTLPRDKWGHPWNSSPQPMATCKECSGTPQLTYVPFPDATAGRRKKMGWWLGNRFPSLLPGGLAIVSGLQGLFQSWLTLVTQCAENHSTEGQKGQWREQFRIGSTLCTFPTHYQRS